jgi:hypothetical protein
MSLFSFLRKYGESEVPLFKSMPVETNPPPDEGQAEELEKDSNKLRLDELFGEQSNG